MALLSIQRPGVAGAVPAYTAVTAADEFPNDGRCYLHVKNGGASPTNVTINDPNSPSPPSATQFDPDVLVAVAAGAEKVIGPFPPHRFNAPDGNVDVTYSVTTSITAAVIGA
jgi:hypothetical protein